MKRFVRGMIFGVGIGLLVAPMRGEEMRRLLRERFEELRRRPCVNDEKRFGRAALIEVGRREQPTCALALAE